MAAKSVEFLEEASADYEAAFDWYFTRSEATAANFANELARAIGMIAEAPQRWPAGPYGARKFLLHRFPFAVVLPRATLRNPSPGHCSRPSAARLLERPNLNVFSRSAETPKHRRARPAATRCSSLFFRCLDIVGQER
jgi:plasmid stabilization system protein ParE